VTLMVKLQLLDRPEVSNAVVVTVRTPSPSVCGGSMLENMAGCVWELSVDTGEFQVTVVVWDPMAIIVVIDEGHVIIGGWMSV
jgi:hypothetical protein